MAIPGLTPPIAVGCRRGSCHGVRSAVPLAALAFLLMLLPQAGAIDLQDVLHGIQMVESGGRDIGLHPDGVTYGRYGVTYLAVRELQRLRLVTDAKVNLRDPATNKRMAELYLVHLHRRYGSWWEAVRHYNPRSPGYARKVWGEMDKRRSAADAT